MKTHKLSSLGPVFTVVVAFGLTTGASLPSHAQQTVTTTTTVTETAPAPLAFDYLFGRQVQERDGNRKTYELRATQPRSSKLTGQAIRVTIEDVKGQDRFTRIISLRTGKHKTVAEFCDVLTRIFHKFEAVTSSNNQFLDKVGDLKYGGEVRFFAETTHSLRYETLTQGEPDRVGELSLTEVATLTGLLGGSGTMGTDATTTVTTVRKTTE